MSIIIEDIRYLDKFRPTETDVDWSLYNIGEPYDIEIDYRVEEVALAQSKNSDDFGWITLQPSTTFSGVLDPTGIIYADDPNAFEFFFVGDTIEVINNFNVSNDGSYTITEKIDNQRIRANTSFVNAYMQSGGTIHVTSLFNGIRYYFNWIENKAATQYIDVTSQQENQLYYDNATTGMGAISMIDNGNGTNIMGGATVEGNGTFTYGQRFTIKHSGVVTPLFLAAQLADTQARLSPDYFESGECLKHVFKLECNRDLSNPNDTQEIVYDERLGNTGWVNENYNGQLQNYTTSDLVFTRVSDSANLDALELSTQVDATFKVHNTVDSPFSIGNTQAMAMFWILPDTEARYQNNGRTLEQNFVYDYALNTVHDPAVNGNNYGTTLQAIEEFEATLGDATFLNVRIRFDFGSLSQSIINENDFKNYLFGFTIENHSLTRETSDKTFLLLNVAEFEIQLFDVNLITNQTGFLFHRYSDYSAAVPSPNVFPVDDMVAISKFDIDFNGLTGDGIDILNVSHELVLKHATNADILVESNTYNTAGSDLLNGYVPLIDVNQNRSFTIEDNNFRKLVTIKRDPTEDYSTTYAYETSYPFFVRWETWEALSVSNPPSGVYDSSLPNNGLNNFLYRYSVEGYTLNYRLRFTILQNGQQFTQEFDSAMTMYDFDSNTDWNNEYVKPYDVSTSTELTSGGDKFIQGYTDTRLEAAFDKTVGIVPALADVDIVFWIIGKEKGTIKSAKRASSFYSDSGDTWFKGITSDDLVDKTKTSTLFEGKVLVDFTKISGSDFTVYSRLHDNISGTPFGECLLLINSNNSVSTFDPIFSTTGDIGTFILGDGSANQVANGISYNYADNLIHKAKFCLPDLSDVLTIDISNDGVVGTLDLSKIDNCTSFKIGGNLFDTVIFPISTATVITSDVWSNVNLTSLDFSGLTNQSGTVSTFNDTNLSSIILSPTNTVDKFNSSNTNFSGVFDASIFGNLDYIRLSSNIGLTGVINPTSLNTFTEWNFASCSVNSYVDFTTIPNATESDGFSLALQINDITSAADINHILVDLDTNSTTQLGWTRIINFNGGTNAAPDGTSGGYDGATAVTNLVAKGFTVTTN